MKRNQTKPSVHNLDWGPFSNSKYTKQSLVSNNMEL